MTNLGHLLLARLGALGHEELHQLHQLFNGSSVLGGVRRDVLERPLDVLVLGKGAAKSSGLGATETEQPVVGGQHRSVEVHDVGVLVVGEDVVERNVLDDRGTVEDELDVVRAVKGGSVPEVEQRLLVLVHWDAWLA